MRKFVPGTLSFILPGLVLLFFSCAPQTCYENTDAMVNASFYLYSTKKILAPDSLTIYGVNMEANKLFDKLKGVTVANLPLDASTSSCIYVIRINDTSDTVNFVYYSFPHLISKECGYSFFHNLVPDSLIYTKHIIDSIAVIRSSITPSNEENIRIYY
jgi:hypothetical protein